jgi:CubicO group peptidase (beta-lactamase class C family)
MQGFPPAPAKVVNKANWLTYPNLSWSFQHARELFPSRAISRDETKFKPFPAALQTLDEIVFDDEKGQSIRFGEFLKATYTDAILVLHKGKVVYEQYANNMTPATRHMLFSVSKSFVGTLAALLVSEGTLDENAPVARYVPELASSAYGDATVRQLMDMRVGAKFSEVYTDPKSDIVAYVLAAEWVPIPPGYQGPRDLCSMMANLKERDGSHGEAFGYKSSTTDVLAWVLRRASGKSLTALLSERIWSKIGAAHDAYYLLDSIGTEVAMGGMNATLRDLARFGQMMLQKGELGGKRILPRGVVEDIMRGGDRDAFARANQPTRLGWSYRSQWWVTHNPNGAYLAMGVHGQRLYIDPKAQMVVAKLGSHPVPGNAFTDPIHARAFHALARALMP